MYSNDIKYGFILFSYKFNIIYCITLIVELALLFPWCTLSDFQMPIHCALFSIKRAPGKRNTMWIPDVCYSQKPGSQSDHRRSP